MTDTTLVTGAAGFAGGHLLDLLASSDTRGGDLVGWYRPKADGPPKGLADRVRWEPVDVLDRDRVRQAVAELKPSVVYHCAGAAHVGRAWDRTDTTLAINVRGTHHVLDAVARTGRPARVLIPSSALVYARATHAIAEDHALQPSDPYGLSKLAQELLSRHAGDGVDVMVARAFNHFGPRQAPLFAASGFARRIADIERGRWVPEISVGNLDAWRDLTDVRDTVRAYQLIIEGGSAGEVFNVCTGRAIAIRDLLNMMIARARVPVTIKVDPARYRPNDQPVVLGNPQRIRERLGWEPRIGIEQTIDDLLEYWRAHDA